MSERINTDLQKMLGEAVELDPPKSRIEKILYKILGYEIELDEPKSRTEKLLMQLAENPPGPEPTGTISITENGNYDVAQYASAAVNVGGSIDTLGAVLQKNMESIGPYSFANAVELNAYFFDHCSNGDLTFPNVTMIGERCFQNYTGKISLPNLASMPGNYEFYGATIDCIELPNLSMLTYWSPTSIFRNASSKKIVLGAVSHAELTIPSSCFKSCTNLEEVDFYANSIGYDAFSGCSKLEKVIVRGTSVASLSATSVFSNTPIYDGNGYIYVPDSLLSQYETATNWSFFEGQFKGLSEL